MATRPTNWDVFICHASEDKELVARPLANELAGYGHRVWLDEAEMRVGDRLRAKIDEGLANSRFGVAILSESFFQKEWTKAELEGLLSRERDGNKILLPVWHEIESDRINNLSPILGGRIGIRTSEGIASVSRKIDFAIRAISPGYVPGTPLFRGNLSKRLFMSLPEGCFILSNAFNFDLTPKIAEDISKNSERGSQWNAIHSKGLSKGTFYVFADASEYRAHMVARGIFGVVRKS